MTDRELYGDDVVYVPVPLWSLPDPCPFPTFDVFPRLAGLGRRVRRLLGWGQ